MKTKVGRYSVYIRPFSYWIDLIIINVLSIYLIPHDNQFWYVILISAAWILTAIYLGFYEIYRYTKSIAIANKTIKQAALFGLFCLILELFDSESNPPKRVVFYIVVAVSLVFFVKVSIYYFLRKLNSDD